jgi:multidrug efflux pump subunit AcrA (membrane-fusion protein)
MTTRTTRGAALAIVLIILALTGLLAVTIWMMGRDGAGAEAATGTDVFDVRRGDFDVIVPASGELAALRQIEIRNELEQRATITYIIDEGVFAKAGDTLVQFNDEEIATNIKDAEDALDSELNKLENAKANLEIRIKTSESELAEADLQITLTKLALRAWEEGAVVETRQNLQLELKTAQMEYDRLQDRFNASQRLYEQEFISLDEFKQDEIALVKADTNLKQADLAIDIYEKYEYQQERAQMESDRQQAIEERDRIKQRNDAEVRSAEADVQSAQRQVDSRRERLEKWQRQLGLCRVIAPSDGLVVYASSLQGSDRGRDEDPPMIGTEVQSRRTVIVLPDTSQMIADVKVNEALSGLISRGQRAVIVSDAKPDLTLAGEVISVGVLAQTGGWRDPNRRDYSVKIRLSDYDRSQGLKPSMRCKADINVGRVTDALYVPIQAVRRKGAVAFVWIPDGRGYSQKQVEVGQASELYVEIKDGVQVGQSVLLRTPEAKEVIATLNIPDAAPGDAFAEDLFGQSPPPAADGGADHGVADQSGNAPGTESGTEPGAGRGNGERGQGGRGGRGRMTPEQLQEMMKNLSPEERQRMQERIDSMNNRGGGRGEGGRDGDERPTDGQNGGQTDGQTGGQNQGQHEGQGAAGSTG